MLLAAWPGRDGAYIYGPVCVDRYTRGTGVLEAPYAEVIRRLPGREEILFINGLNGRSLRAHVGAAPIAFTAAGVLPLAGS
jgi:hypothetical protein